MPLKRTPLFPVYKKYGPRVVDFGGWELPVQFAGINAEHLAVRQTAGLFDVSHMGELRVRGPGAPAFVEAFSCNRAARLELGAAQYSALLNPQGGIIDDIFIYRTGDRDFFLCVNAANARKDFDWLMSLAHPECELADESASWAQIALQGPRAVEILAGACGPEIASIKRLCIKSVELAGVPGLAARTGYTGEDGFEIFVPAESAVPAWEAIMAAGKDQGLVPCGLGARDTLRLEMGYPLHGHDISERTTPLEADLAWIVALDQEGFIGRDALLKQRSQGVKVKRVGLVMEEPGVPRDGYKIVTPGGEGKVTSGTKTPSLATPIALGYVPGPDAVEGREVKVEIRGKLKKARIRKWPFYRPGQ